jgi:hypothetical protein
MLAVLRRFNIPMTMAAEWYLLKSGLIRCLSFSSYLYSVTSSSKVQLSVFLMIIGALIASS